MPEVLAFQRGHRGVEGRRQGREAAAERARPAVHLVEEAARELGIATVAVYSELDRNALHVRLADESVCIGPPPARDSYLNIPAIVSACEITGAEAVHPGYGFLSENARFADILDEHGIKFIGPRASHIRIMGDKIEAKRTAKELGIPVVPGSEGGVSDVDDAKRIARDIGYPVIIKATAGGGGRGMKVARGETDLEIAMSTAQAEAKAAFGNGDVYIEKYLGKPRHIEIQVLGDGQGRAVHLGERDCSLQRRHQKIWEEAHSPALNAVQRDQIGNRVAAAMSKLSYEGVGTVEFLYENGEFYFIEMNTRLQVEHPVTELVTGIDLVEQMILVAAGEKLALRQEDVKLKGWAIEARIYAEDPYRNFLPSTGRLVKYREPAAGPDVRVDSGVYEGGEISMFYDPMIAKLCTYGKDRLTAIDRMRRALDESGEVVGVATGDSLTATKWNRVPSEQPSPIESLFIENPIVEKLPNGHYMALYDSNHFTPVQPDLPARPNNSVSYSVSTDGIRWHQGRSLIVQSDANNWASDLRTPLGLVAEGNGIYTILYTGRMKDKPFWAIGKVKVKLSE